MSKISAIDFEQQLILRGCTKTNDRFGKTGYVWINPEGVDFSVPGPGSDGMYSEAIFIEVLSYAGLGHITLGSRSLN